MKYQYLFFLLISGIGLTAQTYHPFPTKNTMWTEMYTNPYPDEYYKFHSFALKNNDTTINGKLYHKLYHSYDSIFTEKNLCGGIREQNKKIYFYAIDSIPLLGQLTFPSRKKENILYDFSLKLGDTIMNDSFRISHPDKLIVFKVDSILIGSEYRKTITFGYPGDSSELPWAVWVEGLGSLRGLLNATGDVPTNGLWNDLICFREENKWLYHYSSKYNNCYYNTGNAVHELPIGKKITVTPNPASTNAHVELDGVCYHKLLVADLFGRIVRVYDVEGSSSVDVSRGELPTGVYILTLQGKKGVITTTKLIFN